MTTIEFYTDENNLYKGFKASGHAGYADAGEDIVCSSISVLTINTVNSIERLTDAVFKLDSDEKTGLIDFCVENYESSEVQLLLSSLHLGLSEIQKSYKKYLKLTNRRY
jgi:uncharacterized protein YsxB (DUF464 family)